MANVNATSSVRLETVSRDNYDTWKIQAEALLTKNDTWPYVSGEIPAPKIEAEGTARTRSEEGYKIWKKADSKAKADLILSIKPSELKQIRGCDTSRDVWTKLESIYASKGPARKATLLKRLTQHKMQDGDDIKEHIIEFFDAVDKLEAMEININGELLAIMLLYSLPSNFDNFRCAIESRDNLPDAETLKVKILEEHSARNQKDGDDSDTAMFAKSDKKFTKRSKGGANNNTGTDQSKRRIKSKIRCNFCKKIGHKETDCRFKKKLSDKSANKVEEINLCPFTGKASSESHNINNFWCIDSGCTSHLCNNRNAFTRFEETFSTINLANNSATQVRAKGDIKISTANNSRDIITLKNVLYAPDLRTNLISVAKIVDHENEVIFSKTRAVVKDSNGNVKVIANRIGDLFCLRESDQQACTASESKVSKNEMETWHARLGHLNSDDMKQMLLNKDVIGLKFNDHVDSSKCNTCLAGKITSKAFTQRKNSSKELLELIHTDVWGPARVNSQGGARFFVTFIDDYSKWCHIYFLRNKGQVAEKFVEFKNLVENQTGRKIKAIQSDNGTEFCNKRMTSIFKDAGIQQRLTTPYTPQQNGVAERKNRTLVESARCMLLESGMPNSFWAEAIVTANYIRNRCITKALPEGTPYKRWIGKEPDVSHLHTFGERAFILDKTPNKGKFEPKGLQGIFIGYSDNSKGYRFWIPSEHKVRVSRDVKFLNEFGSDHSWRNPSTEEEAFDSSFKEYTRSTSPTLRNVEIDTNVSNTEIPNDGESSFRELDTDTIATDVRDESVRPNVANHEVEAPTKRGPGRPKLSKTGKRGRPAKLYKTRSITANQETIDNETSSKEALENPNTEPSQQSSKDNRNFSKEDENPFQDACVAMNATEIPIDYAMEGPDHEEWFQAIYSEIKDLITNDTWEIVDRPTNSKVIDCRTVLRNKYNPDGTLFRRKARIVARGFSQRPGIDFIDTFAPVARIESFRILMALSVKFNLQVSQFDITTAYLNGDIDMLTYMEQPDSLTKILQEMIKIEENTVIVMKAKDMLRKIRSGDKVCKLRKAIYGLRQSGRQWHEKLSTTLKSIGLKPTNSDPCVYIDYEEKCPLFVLIYVDDIVIASRNPERTKQIKEELARRFDVKDVRATGYCLGIEVRQTNDEITLSQTGYINDILQKFNMKDCKTVKIPLTPGIKLIPEDITADELTRIPYRELIGSLMYLAVGTRPDIAYAVNMLSQFNNSYSQVYWQAAKRILRYLKGTIDKKLIYRQNDDGITGYADADWGNSITDRKSYSEYTFTLSGAAITWRSRKQRVVALSSTEAEYMSLSDAAKEAVFLSTFMLELGFKELSKITLYNDNQSAGKLALNPVHHDRSKHIDIRVHFIRQALKDHPLKLEYLPTEEMTADILTKSLSRLKHENCVNGLGLR